jgi:predicted transcriptional regulator
MVSETQVINALFQEKFFVVFDLIAVEGGDRKQIINSLGLTPKQYHSRISALRKSGLVEKINEKYFLTSFGKVVHEARQLIESAIKDYWKFESTILLYTPNEAFRRKYEIKFVMKALYI